MKVYQIKLDVNNYQAFLPEDESVWGGNRMTMDCSPKIETWSPPKIYVLKPKLKKGDFFHFCAGGLVVGPKAIEELRDLLEMSGELLPLFYEGEEYALLNVLECINCLDQDGSEWVYGKTSGKRIMIKQYRFHPNRFVETPLFKIPETCRGEILTVVGLKDPEDEFKSRVEMAGLKGLIFEEIWSG